MDIRRWILLSQLSNSEKGYLIICVTIARFLVSWRQCIDYNERCCYAFLYFEAIRQFEVTKRCLVRLLLGLGDGGGSLIVIRTDGCIDGRREKATEILLQDFLAPHPKP
jgi:hypothetical protein